jgi:NAD(P)-dependent dehydrogenase (short-subunit alcohol dehydrogenase family)
VDILVANAGIFLAKPTADLTDEDVDAIIGTNLKGFLYPARAAARHMSANGNGHIVAITACIAMQPNAKLPALLPVLTKGGLNHAVRALALELAPTGVQVNAVAPGVIDTPMFPRDEQTWAFLRTFAPTARTGVPQDVVDAVLYLTGSTYVTGSIMTVDGGSTAGTW